MKSIVLAALMSLALATGAVAEERRFVGEAAVLAERAEQFLAAYVANDRAAAFAMIDPTALDVYGGDVSEHAAGPDDFNRLLTDDQRLWSAGGGARFGPMRNVSVRVSRDMGSVFFDAPFSVGGQQEVIVRFATVWRKRRGQWLVTQSANGVPTTGSSAAEILARLERSAP